jgi:hydroxyethylthiazole kinase-like uncharacterized protein yjeF
MDPAPLRIDASSPSQPLHGVQASRRIEAHAAKLAPTHVLMQRAGLALARMAVAIAPHARRIWVAAGPGNNGGDGFEAAMHLQQAGYSVQVSALGDPARLPSDAAASRSRAQRAGVPIGAEAPAADAIDLVIDALLGLGARQATDGAMAAWIEAVNRVAGPRLAADVPSGLHPDTGVLPSGAAVRASHTLAFLTLKPGLFTGLGRDQAGEIWFDPLASEPARQAEPADAWLTGPDIASRVRAGRAHAGHKGRYGDVLVVGGAPGMGGALLLAARTALGAGAGRVLACPLDASMPSLDGLWPELMWRPAAWRDTAALAACTVVAGCGGGSQIGESLPGLLSRSARLVLDADALNAVAADTSLQHLLRARSGQGRLTILTPHPLEAARLLGQHGAAAVQADRLSAAQRLATRFDCCVLLKGSGSVIAAPQQAPAINPSGNARLASAGTGDVLAGLLGGLWSAAQANAVPAAPFDVACAGAWLHGRAAEQGNRALPLPASLLAARLDAEGESAS